MDGKRHDYCRGYMGHANACMVKQREVPHRVLYPESLTVHGNGIQEQKVAPIRYNIELYEVHRSSRLVLSPAPTHHIRI